MNPSDIPAASSESQISEDSIRTQLEPVNRKLSVAGLSPILVNVSDWGSNENEAKMLPDAITRHLESIAGAIEKNNQEGEEAIDEEKRQLETVIENLKRNKESYRTSGYIENHAQLNALQKRLGDDLLESSVRIELEKVLLWRTEKDKEGNGLKREGQDLEQRKGVLEAQIKKGHKKIPNAFLGEVEQMLQRIRIKKTNIIEEVQEPVREIVSNLPTSTKKRLHFTKGMRLAAYGLLVVLGGGALTYNYQTAREKAKEEELSRQNRLEECLRRYPAVSAWFGEEGKKLTILQIEESNEKIEFVNKYPDLVTKYSGRKILEVKMIDLVWQKPETINSHHFIVQKIQADWERFCLEKEDQIIELYFRGSEEYQKGIITLFAQVHPYILLAPSDSLKGHISADQFSGSNVPTRMSLKLRTKNGPPFAYGNFASSENFTNAMLGRGMFTLRAKIKEQKDGFDPETILRIGGGLDEDLARKVSEIMNKDLNYPPKFPKPVIFTPECLVESGPSGFPGFARLVNVGMTINYALPEGQQANHIITIPIGAYLDSAADGEGKKSYLQKQGVTIPQTDILEKKNWLELILGQTEESARAQDRRIQSILEKNIGTFQREDWDLEKIRASLLQDEFFTNIPQEIVHIRIYGSVIFVRLRDGSFFHDIGWGKKG